MTIIIDFHRAVSDKLNASQDGMFSDLIKDLKKTLKDPSLPIEKKREIAERIALIENRGRERRSEHNLDMLVCSIYELGLGCLLGPVGSGIGTMTISNRRRTINSNRKVKICKAQMVGGRRIHRKKRQSKSSIKKGIDKTCLLEGAYSYLSAVGWAVATVPAACLAGRIWYNLTG